MKSSKTDVTNSFGLRLASKVESLTRKKTAEIGLRHAKANARFISHSIADLAKEENPPDAAIVVAAGPSLHRQNIAEQIKASKFKGQLVACDGALGFCLRNGIVPDYVICVDPHPKRIVRWFGDRSMKTLPKDDYFRRQDLEPYFLKHELERNEEMIELVNHHGPAIKAVLSTSVSRSVTNRVIESGMKIYWWNPIYDDYDVKNSYTRRIYQETKVPCMMTGGNCGSSAWVFAGSVLKAKHVAVVGMDFGYRPGTSYRSTGYYRELQKMFGKDYEKAYIHIENPYLKEKWYTDPAYYWYRESMLFMASEAPCTTYNCTQGGILFGKGIQWTTLADFFKKVSRTNGNGN